ncbi:unnamed protein product, partial [Closterium sp. NIES-54]
DISVGDVVAMRYDPATVAFYAKSANPEASAETTANDGAATEAVANHRTKAGAASRIRAAASSFKSNNPKKAMKRKNVAQSEAVTNTVNRATHATPLSVPKTDMPMSELPVAFRRVAAVAGDEIVLSRLSDELFRIEKDHFWLLADNLAVPAKEAIDSRTIGPVHRNYILERALFVVRPEEDHGPIQS